MALTYAITAASCAILASGLTTLYTSKKRVRLLKAQSEDFQQKISEVVDAKKQVEDEFEQLKSIAYYDELTGLENLTKFNIELKKLLQDNPDSNYALLVFEISNF